MQEVVHKIKEQFRGVLDEYASSPLAPQAKVLIVFMCCVSYSRGGGGRMNEKFWPSLINPPLIYAIL